jgi:hypothetical protein
MSTGKTGMIIPMPITSIRRVMNIKMSALDCFSAMLSNDLSAKIGRD